MKIIPVLLAGGIGERFWPMSRSSRPKQLLPLAGKKTMIEETLARVRPLARKPVRPLVVTGKAIASLMRKTVPSRLDYDTIVEPVGKNTAPAVAAAAAWIEKRYGESLMAVLSADHAIAPAGAFVEAVRYAAGLARDDDRLVVFGIRPARPDTGYGYVRLGRRIGEAEAGKAYRVMRFVEKPSPAKARAYVRSGSYLWNSGMFVWKTSTILAEIDRHMPALGAQTRTLARGGFRAKDIAAFYRKADKESIDYGVMEKSSRVAAVCANFDWDDIGSWESISRLHTPSDRDVTIAGRGVYEDQCANAIIVNDSPMTVAAFGVTDLAVVAVGDAVMVIPRSKLPDVKGYVTRLKQSGSAPSRLF